MADNEERLTAAEWEARLKQTTEVSDYDARQEKIARISSDPAPKWREEPKRNYETTEKHYIICCDEDKANASLPEAFMEYGEPHKLGAFLVSDRKHIPEGWLRSPPRGTSVETIKESHPVLYALYKEKKMEQF